MSNIIETLTAKFKKVCQVTGESEQRVIEQLAKRSHVSRNIGNEYEENLTFGQRFADLIAQFGGSWTFIILFLILLSSWILFNTIAQTRVSIDPYPFIFLNLILSMIAALQAPVIMMSQNRHSAKDRAAAQHDYEVNLKAELEILALHEKIDTLRQQQWIELVEMQQVQIQLLKELHAVKKVN